jgi:hypothetical protein
VKSGLGIAQGWFGVSLTAPCGECSRLRMSLKLLEVMAESSMVSGFLRLGPVPRLVTTLTCEQSAKVHPLCRSFSVPLENWKDRVLTADFNRSA